jgi:hypothetical protein
LDFLAIIRSLEELLYEVMSWLIFYPRTLWRITVNPAGMTLYSDDEQDDAPAERYSDALSPPLLLLITLVLCHIVELSFGLQGPKGDGGTVAKTLVGSEQSLLMVRALLFAVIPVTIASIVLRMQHKAFDRETLRAPFYSQCYLVVPFALLASLAGNVARAPGHDWGGAGGAMFAVALVWFVWAETLWLRRQLGLGGAKAFLTAIACVVAALLVCLFMAFLVSLAI